MDDIKEQRLKLLGSLLLFTQVFYKLRTGREFVVSSPIGREPHQITICRELTDVFRNPDHDLLVNVPPGHGKSEHFINFVPWAFAHYPDCQFLYISYSSEVSSQHTYTIKQIMQMPLYKRLFGIEIPKDSSAKDNFRTNYGGAVKAFGSSGSITGMNAGLQNQNRFSGGVIMDDMHKPQEVHSDTMRKSVNNNYLETIIPRPRGMLVPLMFIGQCLHEDDLAMNIRKGFDKRNWKKVILKAVDNAGNVLAPNIISKERLLTTQEVSPYVYSAQYQQEPQPAGGGIFKPEWFVKLDIEPEIIATFITIDSAETDKTYNDATVFSFFGIYRLKDFGVETNLFGLHWIDCKEIRVEPKDLEAETIDFCAHCLRYPVPPQVLAIEKKSTGVTLSSVIKNMRGIKVIDIERTRASGSKTARYLEAQPYVASKQVSLPTYGEHTEMCIEHMKKITANNTHAHDDIADTLYDGIKAGLIDKIIYRDRQADNRRNEIVARFAAQHNTIQTLRERAYEKR